MKSRKERSQESNDFSGRGGERDGGEEGGKGKGVEYVSVWFFFSFLWFLQSFLFLIYLLLFV